jgi:hypothetical protein
MFQSDFLSLSPTFFMSRQHTVNLEVRDIRQRSKSPAVTIKNQSSFDSIILLTESSTGFIHKIKITEYFYSTKVLSV